MGKVTTAAFFGTDRWPAVQEPQPPYRNNNKPYYNCL